MTVATFNPSHDSRMIACEIAGVVPVPGRVLIVPWGNVQSVKGDFVVDSEAARLILEAFGQSRLDVPFDYEHQTLGGEYSSPTGQAPAAGWIKSLDAVPGDGIYGNVEWTRPAADAISLKQYRYLSPVVLVRKGDHKAVSLHSVALTNKPAIRGLAAIVNSAGGGSPEGGQCGSGGFNHADKRAARIQRAGRAWDGEPMLASVCSRSAFIDDALDREGFTPLSNTERGLLSTRGVGPGSNRAELIKALASEWNEHLAQLKRITNRETYVNGSLLAGGLTGLTEQERKQISTLEPIACGGIADAEAGQRRLSIILGDNPRAVAIRKLALEWKSNPYTGRGTDGLQRYVGYNLDEELGGAATPELTQQERDALNELIREDFASI